MQRCNQGYGRIFLMKLNQSNHSAIIRLWNNVMKRLTIHPKAKARQLLTRLEDYKKLSATEAAMLSDALKNSGVPDAANRLNAGWARILLKQVA